MSSKKLAPTKEETLSSPQEFNVVEQWDEYIADLPKEISLERAKAEAGFISEWIQRYDTGAMMAKFCLGTISYLANPKWRNETKYGASIIEKLSEKHGINPNTLREARRCAEFFSLDLSLYYDWVTENGRVKNWTDVRKLIRAWNDPEVLGPENLTERLAKRIESTGEDLQKLRQRVHEGEIDRETYEGVEQEFLREIESFEEVKEEALEEDSNRETPRDDEYLNWVRAQRCEATGSPPPNEAHHVEQGGQGMKGSDYSVIPLSNEVHEYLENHGHRAAEEKYNFSITESLFKCIHEYFFGYRPNLPPDITYHRRIEHSKSLKKQE